MVSYAEVMFMRARNIIMGLLIFIMGQDFAGDNNPFVIAAMVATVLTGYKSTNAGTWGIVGVIVAFISDRTIELENLYPVIITLMVCSVIFSEKLIDRIKRDKRWMVISVCSFLAYASALYSINGINVSTIVMPVIMCAMVRILYKTFEMVALGEFPAPASEQLMSIIIYIVVAIAFMPDWGNEYVSIKMTVAMFVVLCMSYCYGVGAGTLCGVLCGMAVGESILYGLVFVAVYAIGGIIASIMAGLGRLVSATAFGVFICMFYLYTSSGFLPGIIADMRMPGACLGACILFVFLPMKTVIGRIRYEKDNVEEFNGDITRRYTKFQLESISEEFMRLSDKIHVMANDGDDADFKINGVMEDVTTALCSACMMREKCWEENYGQTMKVVGEMFNNVMSQCQGITTNELPEESNDCIYWKEMVLRTRFGLENAKRNLMWQRRMAQIRETVARQIKEVSGVINNYSASMLEPVNLSFTKRTRLIRKLLLAGVFTNGISILKSVEGRYVIAVNARCDGQNEPTLKDIADILSEVVGRKMVSSARNEKIKRNLRIYNFYQQTTYKVMNGQARLACPKEDVNGDNYTFLYTPDKNMVVALADGMGTGQRAYMQSCNTIEIFERYIEAGFAVQTGVRMLELVSFAAGCESESSTIDVCLINRYTGICEFVKAGATYSFIKRKKQVDTIHPSSYPVGVLEGECDTIARKLYDGDYVIMISDGIADCFDNEGINVLEKYIADKNVQNPGKMADDILKYAVSKSGGVVKDDMTVLVTGIWKRR